MTGPLITAAQLQRFAPSCDHLALAPALDAACRRFDIVTSRRIARFMGQVHHESAGLTQLEEGLYYTMPERIREVWPTRFPSVESARPFVRKPKALALKVYGGREDLGNRPGTEDGWTYRGGGLIGNTGLANYRAAGVAIGVDLVKQPGLLRQPKVAALAAAAFWQGKGLNELADLGDVEAISIRINGGRNGLDDRKRQTARAALIWRE